jgi:hypothetical protein
MLSVSEKRKERKVSSEQRSMNMRELTLLNELLIIKNED